MYFESNFISTLYQTAYLMPQKW